MLFLFSLFLFFFGIGLLWLKHFSQGIFNVLWGCILLICSQSNMGGDYFKTKVLISIMILFVNIGFFCGVFTIKRKRKSVDLDSTVLCNYQLMSIILFVAVVVLSFYAVITFSKYGFNLMLIRGANNSDSDVKVFNGLFDTIIYYGFAIPILYVASFFVAYNIAMKNKIPKNIVVFTSIGVFLYVITLGGRTLIIKIVAAIMAAFIWRIHSKNKKERIKIRYFLIFGVIIYGVLNLITSLRNTVDITFFDQLVRYMRTSVAHMSYQLHHLNETSVHFGYVTYGGFLYYPVKLLNIFWGGNIETSNEIMLFLQNFVTLTVDGDLIRYNALVPNTFFYYYDSGYIGVVLFSFFLGLGTHKLEFDVNRPSFFKFSLWAMALYAICYSSMGGVLWSFAYPTALIYSFILDKLLFKKVYLESNPDEL